MIAIVHFIYSQSVHALALNAGSMDNDAGRYCTCNVNTLKLSSLSVMHSKNSFGGFCFKCSFVIYKIHKVLLILNMR